MIKLIIMKSRFFILCAVVFTTLCFSCKKEEKPVVDNETQSALDNVKSQEAVMRTFSDINQYGINEDGIKSAKLDSCPLITISSIDTVFPKTLTIDFGTVGCQGYDGKFRQGKLTVVFSNHWLNNRINGTYAEATCDNYIVDGQKLEGVFIVTYNGLNSSNGPTYNIKATNAKLTLLTGKNISWNSNETVDWIAGYDNLNLDDDVILISGSSSGVTSEGTSYTMNITKPLKKDNSCKYITEGTIELTPEKLNTRTVDFGDGTCDSNATVTILGVSVNISF